MNLEQLLQAIGSARPDYLEASENVLRRKKLHPWVKVTALAACAVLAIGLAGFAMLVLTPAGSSAPGADAEAPTEAAAGIGSTETTADGGSIFLSYAGPVLPLTLAEENEYITAERNIALDFAPYGITEEEHLDCCRNLTVTDEYLITNFAPTEQTVTVRYPYVSSFRDRWERDAVLTVGSAEVESILTAGDYIGGYYSLDPHSPDLADERWNIQAPENWEDLAQLPGLERIIIPQQYVLDGCPLPEGNYTIELSGGGV